MNASPQLTLASFKAETSLIHQTANRYFKTGKSHVEEAVASGYRFRTAASLYAGLNKGPVSTSFSQAAFVARLGKLERPDSAEAIGVLLDGAKLTLEIERRSQARQRADHFSDVAYDVRAKITAADSEMITGDLIFLLPNFAKSSGEPYRVDSAHQFRQEVEHFAVTRDGRGRGLMTAKLVAGEWQGGLFIYDHAHQLDDIKCLGSVKAALARALLGAASSRVRCSIFRPDRYDVRAHRVELQLGSKVRSVFRTSPLTFELPVYQTRLIVTESAYGSVALGVGKFVGDTWNCDVYSNGISEEENPVSLADFKAQLLANVNDVLTRAGFSA